MPTPSPLLAQAREYAERFRWAIIPVRGKEPACKWERYRLDRPGPRQLSGLFSIRGVTGLAVLLGRVSDGLRVRDFDVAESYYAWARARPDLAASLPTSRTPRGFHVYFRSEVAEGLTYLADGELRAGRGYVLLPPSAHPAGGSYEWVVPPAESIPLVPCADAAGLSGTPVTGVASVPQTVHEAIKRSRPGGYGQRVRKLWEFARRLKGIPDLDTSAAALGCYVRAWYEAALPNIRTRDFGRTELAFYDAWTKAEVPLADEPFVAWVRPVLDGPHPDWLAALFFPESGKRLVRVCAALQGRAGAEPFFLAARAAGAVLGVDQTYANDLLKRLVTAGYLEVVEKGSFATRLATTWRYKGPPVPTDGLSAPPSVPALGTEAGRVVATCGEGGVGPDGNPRAGDCGEHDRFAAGREVPSC